MGTTQFKASISTYGAEGILNVKMVNMGVDCYVAVSERDCVLTLDLASLPDLIATLQLIQAKGERS